MTTPGLCDVHSLMKELGRLHIRIWLDELGVHLEPANHLPQELRDELRRLKPEITDYLTQQGEEVVVVDAIERAHQINTPSAPEMTEQEKMAVNARASRRSYQGGAVLINHSNSMVNYMRQLRRLAEEREARDRGDAPPAGRYKTDFDPFRD
jgi:hypothetical protein